MGLQQSSESPLPSNQPLTDSEPGTDISDNNMTIETQMTTAEVSQTVLTEAKGVGHSQGGGESHDHDHDHDHGHGHAHSHEGNEDGCCGHSHGCMCAMATKNIIKSFLPLLSEERQGELDGWTLNDETWTCVPNADAPSFAIMQAVYAYKVNKPANEAPAVNAFMKVLNTLNHHVKAFDSAFYAKASHETDTCKHLQENTMRCVFPTHRYGAWIGIMIDVAQKHAVIYDPSATLSETDKEELEAKLAPFKTTKLSVMTPKNPIHMRYSALVVCAGLEVLVRAGFASVAPRVFGQLAEIIAAGSDLETVLDGLTEESMHAGEEDSEVDQKERRLALKLVNLAIDHACNAVASQFADRIVWSLGSGELHAPKWTCKCAASDEDEANENQAGSEGAEDSDTEDSPSDKENVPLPAEPEEVDESPAPKKRKEEHA